VNRLTKAAETIAVTFQRGYDGVNRLTSETTPQGNITYVPDAAGRRASMQVTGQPLVTYGYDVANNLKTITQGSSQVQFSYDGDNRRSTLTLPNGIVGTYSFDQDSRLTGIAYTLGASNVGNLIYGNDMLGRRTSVSGTLAATGFPAAVSLATYDVANELTNWNGATISYDSNGNMLSDGIHSYTWDTRNQLATVDAGSTGAFAYDPFGRRVSKSILGGAATSFFYDGANPVQELSGTTPTANLMTGGVDEYFTRTDASGSRNFLPDALGSTLALTDSTGALQTEYRYDPFGNTTNFGQSTASGYAYAGRENDGTGLYFNRARYYSPQFSRFISEDPLGFGGGDANLYSYVFENPINLGDPWLAHLYVFCKGGDDEIVGRSFSLRLKSISGARQR
jgi:RHS repeat-associated protein